MKTTTPAVLAIALLAAAMPAAASTVHTLRGVPFTVDTLRHYPVGPGAVYTELRYQSQNSTAKHFTANVIVFDLNEAKTNGLDFRMHLGRDSVHTSERVTDMAARHTDADNHYFAAINGDFFITWSSTPGMLGYPNNTACTGGQMALSDNVDHDNHVDAWIMDRNFNMWCDQTVLSNKLILSDNTTQFKLYGVNFARRDDARRDAEDDSKDIVFYNEHRGRYTGSPAGWKEVPVVLAEGADWQINKSVKLVVSGPVSTTGHMAIPRNGGVIACGPNASLDLSTIEQGDWVKVKLNLSLPTFDNLKPDVKEVVGGDVTLLRNGEAVMEANRFINSRDGEYPRTMVGYDADRTIMVWCTVDGKTQQNTGCTYPQGADLMKALGCIDAINFDGGGSTMMWTKPDGIVNTPSDGSERAVGSGLFAVLQAPTDPEIASICFRDYVCQAPVYSLYTPVILGFNRYGQLVDTNVKNYTLSCPESMGHVSDDGTSVMLDGEGSFLLTADLNGKTASVVVNVSMPSEVTFNTTDMLIDNHTRWDILSYAKIGNGLAPISPLAMTWTSSNPEVASVDANGQVTGHADGTAVITAAVGQFEGTINVTVECPVGYDVDLENPVVPENWTTSGSGVKDAVIAAHGDAGFNVTFSLSSPRSPRIALAPKTAMQLWSLPRKILFDFTPSGAVKVENATLNFTPANDRMQKIKVEGIVSAQSNVIEYDLSEAVDLDDPCVYPLKFNNITFYLSGATGDQGVFTVDRLQAVYPSFSGVDNPLMPDADADATAPVEYFNLQGVRVAAPGAGLYIMRRGSTVRKVIIR